MILALLPLLTGCLTLDTLVHNGVPCSSVGPETCEEKGTWDSICLTCDQPYDWQAEYPWMDGTLEDGDEIRPIPDDHVALHTVPTEDGLGELDVVVLAGPDADPAAPGASGPVVLYSHGNYGGLEHYAPRLRMLWEGGYTVVSWDYRGYGKSLPASAPTGEQFLADARTMRSWTTDTLGVEAAALVVYGYSLGSIPAVEQALAASPCALLLEAPFPGIRLAQEANTGLDMPASFLTSGSFENVDKLPRIPAPVLVMGGDADQLFPAEDFAAMAQAAPDGELWLLPGVGHGIGGGGVPEAGLRDWLARVDGHVQAAGCRQGSGT